MPVFLQFIIRRLFYALLSVIVITMILYAGVMLTPPEARASLYMPAGRGGDRATEEFIQSIIRANHLDEPYLIQYAYWAKSLLNGTWGYSPTLRGDVLPALLERTPATLELAIYSLALLIPFGLASGLIAGWKSRGLFDGTFRALAFFGTSMPPFIFSMILMAIFYVKLGWFAPGRLDMVTEIDLQMSGFIEYTGAMTIDSLLNKRYGVFFMALRHLAMPVLTLSMYHWATLGRITRSTVMTERGKEYIMAARARGVKEKGLIWGHALPVIFAPSLTAIAFSAANILTGVFVVEIIFNLRGISKVIVTAMSSSPDAPAALGFAVYSVLLVMGITFFLDIVQAVVDPRIREEILKA